MGYTLPVSYAQQLDYLNDQLNTFYEYNKR